MRPLYSIGRQSKDGKFDPPHDGWVQILQHGDFPNEAAGIVQHVDDEAFNRIVANFREDKRAPNWPGMLVDKDHFSHQGDKPSEAAAWIDDLDVRPDGLWAHWRLTDTGLKAVTGGDYRLLSPVLSGFERYDGAPSEKHLRPTRLGAANGAAVALTNDPNIKNMAPVSNRKAAGAVSKPQTQERNMNHTEMLKGVLGVAADATDELIDKAYKALQDDVAAMNRARKAEEEEARKAEENTVEALNRRIEELEVQLADQEASRFDALVGDDEQAREALRALAVANRGALSTVMKAIKPLKVEATPLPSKPDALPPLFNRRIQPLPGAAKPDKEQASELAATKTRLRAQEILALNRKTGMTFQQAWRTASAEVEAGADPLATKA